jgi:hypothetical protein
LPNFSGKGKASAYQIGGDGDNEANTAGCHCDKKKDKKRHDEDMVAMADRAT